MRAAGLGRMQRLVEVPLEKVDPCEAGEKPGRLGLLRLIGGLL
jgi:hypothetical protein